MGARADIRDLAQAINRGGRYGRLALRDEDLDTLEDILGRHPELWPNGVADTLVALQRRLGWEAFERGSVPEVLLAFFDETFRRDLDPMAMARDIGRDLCDSCSDCGCRC
ncbi:MAG TPA: hypothetical protein VN436_16815 [Holophaga sp.]|nr:hypothetical protein [Holophaga sp.]